VARRLTRFGFRAIAAYRQMVMRFFPPRPVFIPVTGAPYSGEIVNESVQVLSDGTRITKGTLSWKVYRDSAGRTREDRPFWPPGLEGQIADAATITKIVDPVAQVKYELDACNKVAHKKAIRAQGGTRGTSSGPATRILTAFAGPPGAYGPPQRTTENLEPQTIEGVTAKGVRYIMTWPPGMVDNDQPTRVVNEIWTSPELHVLLLNKTTDLRSGERIQRLTNISTSEPDPSLFQVPADYCVVDDKKAFRIRWGPKGQ
jgi:hypothetical protein